MQNKLLYYLSPLGKLIAFLFLILIYIIPVSLLFLSPQFAGLFKLVQPIYQDIFQETILIVVVSTALMMVFKIFPAYNWQQVFWRNNLFVLGFLKGTLIGLGIMLVVASLLLTVGAVSFQFNGLFFPQLLSYFFLFFVVAVFEEFLFRSFPLVVLAERYPLVITMLLNGVLFAGAHLANPGFTALAFVNIALAGCLFSLFIIQKWNIAWAIGIHFGWNFSQGVLLGYKVSGLPSKGILLAKPIGEKMVSGGDFGIEGSIVCTIILLLFIVGFFIKYKIHPLAVVEEQEVEK
jgi:membrane protease YdiL (CAAX protease family)